MTITIPSSSVLAGIKDAAAGVKSTDRAAPNAVIQAATAAAASVPNADIAPAVLRKQVFTAALPLLDPTAAHVIAAKTAIDDAAAITSRRAEKYKEVFGTEDLSGRAVDSGRVVSALAGQISSARTLGAEDAHDGWYASRIDALVRTSTKEGKLQNRELKEKGLTEIARVEGRNTGAPLAVLKAEADATKDESGKADHRQALGEAVVGIDVALNAVAHTVVHGAIKFKEFEGAADEGVRSPIADAKPSVLFSHDQRLDLRALGQRLQRTVDAFDRDPAGFKWEDQGDAVNYARNGQFFFVNRDLGRDSTKQTLHDGIAAFEKLSKEAQVQNLRSAVAGIASALVSEGEVRDALAHGSTAGQQVQLDNGSQAALGMKRRGDGRRLHAEVITDVASPQILYLLGVKPDQSANDALVAVRSAVNKAVQEAGYKLVFEGAGAASEIAVEMSGIFLRAAFPERFASEDVAKAYAKKLFLGAGYDACIRFAQSLGHDVSKLGGAEAVKGAIVEAKKDDWGIEGLKKIEARGSMSFNVQEQADFGILMTLFNATWATTQEGRARTEEKAGKGDARVRKEQRDVYQGYLKMLRTTGPLDCVFRIAQDLMEAQKKSV